MTRGVVALLIVSACCRPPAAGCQEPLERIVIDDDFPGAYQVEVADINGDRKPDIVALGGGTCAWYENPSWTKRIITGPAQTPGVITSAAADLNGDGKAEVAIGYEFEMNEPTSGRLGLAAQGPDGGWTFRPIREIGSIHRIRWRSFDDGRRHDLVVAPIFGPTAHPPDYRDPARLRILDPGEDPLKGVWNEAPIARRPVVHAIAVERSGEDTGLLLTADNEGIGVIPFTERPAKAAILHGPLRPGDFLVPEIATLITGTTGEDANRGCSEVHIGRINASQSRFIATIEPWHGSQVVIYSAGPNDQEGFRRLVVDDTLDGGHALWVADINGDGNDEVFAGHRGKSHRVAMYQFDPRSGRWDRAVIDSEIAAQDLRGGDLDGDGSPDVVAVGGSTHNVVWYRPRRP